MSQEITISCGNLSIGICPKAGGSLSHFTWFNNSSEKNNNNQSLQSQFEILRRISKETIEICSQNEFGGDMSCYPLVPFSNRIENGKFVYKEKLITLSPHRFASPNSLHGQGWESKWDIKEQTETRCVITYNHQLGKDNWPFSYTAEQIFQLYPDNYLDMSVAVTNNNCEETMPLGFGFHPFFNKTEHTKITLLNTNNENKKKVDNEHNENYSHSNLKSNLDHVWINDKNKIPIEMKRPIPEEWNFSNGQERYVKEMEGIDHCFGGWDGSPIEIQWPEQNLSLQMNPITLNNNNNNNNNNNDNDTQNHQHEGKHYFKHLVVFAPSNESFFCVEPVTNVTNAFSMLNDQYSSKSQQKQSQEVNDTGTIELKPKQTVTATVRFQIRKD